MSRPDRANVPTSREQFDEIWSRPNVDDETVADWRGTLDAMLDDLDAATIGYWGMSQGTMMGVPLIAAEPRIEVTGLELLAIDVVEVELHAALKRRMHQSLVKRLVRIA